MLQLLKKLSFYLLLLIISACAKKDPDYKKAALPVDERINDLLSRMTVEEKVKQLQCLVFQDVLKENVIDSNGIGGMAYVRVHLPFSISEEVEERNRIQKYVIQNTRLGIPVLFHCEALHGLVDKGSTSFPQAIGLASSWNTDLMSKVSNAISKEVKSRGFRQVLSPTIDIGRDVRWGRVAETYGEDPYLTSRMAVAFIKSFEDKGVITTPKHFVANSGDGGRDSHPVHHSDRLLNEVYFPPYIAAIQEGGSRSIMASYTSVNGIPSGINKWLLTDVLRKDWGFDGTVVTDYTLIGKLWKAHLVAEDSKHAAAMALKAGLDRDLPRIGENNGFKDLPQALAEGLITEKDLDRAVKRVLKQKFTLGLFENPYSDPTNVESITNSSEHKDLALEAARQSLVLLKNNEMTLPLKPGLKNILVLGPDANQEKLGDYSPWDIEVVTILEGIKELVSDDVQINYLDIGNKEDILYPALSKEHLFFTQNGNNKPGIKAQYFDNMLLQGNPVISNIANELHFSWGYAGPDRNRSKRLLLRLYLWL